LLACCCGFEGSPHDLNDCLGALTLAVWNSEPGRFVPIPVRRIVIDAAEDERLPVVAELQASNMQVSRGYNFACWS
jgi:hypothetical protein